jgi:hypothetical protein
VFPNANSLQHWSVRVVIFVVVAASLIADTRAVDCSLIVTHHISASDSGILVVLVFGIGEHWLL